MPHPGDGICGRFDVDFALNSTPGWVGPLAEDSASGTRHAERKRPAERAPPVVHSGEREGERVHQAVAVLSGREMLGYLEKRVHTPMARGRFT